MTQDPYNITPKPYKIIPFHWYESSFPEGPAECAVNLNKEYIGTPEDAKYLCDELGISPECIPGNRVCSIGFSEKEQKWFGWSHRALFGFGIGSEVKKGDCAYIPDTVDGLYESYVEFYADVADVKEIQKRLTKQYFNNTLLVSFEDAYCVLHPGKGEWTAKTLDDAKEMAIVYARSVA